MAKKKIFNDPVYGFTGFPCELVYDLIETDIFQRLRRISQLGMTHYVYPGALHTRFQHALGATYLMSQALNTLREKNIEITGQEYEGALIAILLHDIGHGPFSHALEHSIIDIHHEEISGKIMDMLNNRFDGRLSLAIKIFKGSYEKKFLHELVSSQLDMDRMDYLIRDSYFTGVIEGVVGYDRIIKMMNVVDGNLVIEEKGLYSIEKFLIARRLMYWQVYLHKTVLSAEQMLIFTLKRAKKLIKENVKVYCSKNLYNILKLDTSDIYKVIKNSAYISLFAQIDDVDIMSLIKENTTHPDFLFSYLCKSLLERKLFKIYLQGDKLKDEEIASMIDRVKQKLGVSFELAKSMILMGEESNQAYSSNKEEIRMLLKSGKVIPLSEIKEAIFDFKIVKKYFYCIPDV